MPIDLYATALITNKYKTGNVPSSFVKCVVCFLAETLLCIRWFGFFAQMSLVSIVYFVFCPRFDTMHCVVCFLPTHTLLLCIVFCCCCSHQPPCYALCFFGSCPRFVAVHWFVFCPHFVAMHCVVVVFLPPTSLLCIVWFGSCPRIVAVHCVVCFLPQTSLVCMVWPI